MGAILGRCVGALFRSSGARSLKVGSSAVADSGQSTLTDAEVLEALWSAPLVHPSTPEALRVGDMATAVESMLENAIRDVKTGDVVLFDKKPDLLTQVLRKVGLSQRTVVGGCFTHAGIILRFGGRIVIMESILTKKPYDIVEGNSPNRVAGGIRFFGFRERIFTYPGNTFILPLKHALAPDAEERLLKEASATWRRK
jgi:hypothetical protein